MTAGASKEAPQLGSGSVSAGEDDDNETLRTPMEGLASGRAPRPVRFGSASERWLCAQFRLEHLGERVPDVPRQFQQLEYVARQFASARDGGAAQPDSTQHVQKR